MRDNKIKIPLIIEENNSLHHHIYLVDSPLEDQRKKPYNLESVLKY